MGPQAGQTKKLVLKSKYGPIYIHFNRTCLKKCDTKISYAQDEDFDYTQISANNEAVNNFS